jgi:hypothetical protein
MKLFLKQIVWATMMIAGIAFLSWNNLAHAEAQTKKVCKEKTDKAGKPILDKAGKPQEECKTIKIHEKLEATKVEDVKKK